MREDIAQPLVVDGLRSWNRQGPAALGLEQAAQPRGDVVETLIHKVVGVMFVVHGHCRIGPLWQLINDGVKQGNADGNRPGKFGDRLCFWGGIDTHRALCQGSPEAVREEVKKQIEILGKGGGYILAAVHNIQDDVNPENIVAMFEAAKEFGKYE
jgi:hypothetical protein